jgi:hypothetical protein
MRPRTASKSASLIRKALVLRPDRTVGVGEVERDAVVEFHHVEMGDAGRAADPAFLPGTWRTLARINDRTDYCSDAAAVWAINQTTRPRRSKRHV